MAADRANGRSVGRRRPITVDLPAHASSPGAARTWLRTIADTTTLPDGVVSDAALVLSELVTNAVVHAATDVHVSVELRADTGIHIEVGDDGTALPQLVQAGPEHIGGVGMRIVDQLAAAWGVRRVGAGKVVWADVPGRDLVFGNVVTR